MADQRRKYPREFKIEAVRRVIDRGETTAEVARLLDLQPHMLYSWVRQFKADTAQSFRGNGNVTAQRNASFILHTGVLYFKVFLGRSFSVSAMRLRSA